MTRRRGITLLMCAVLLAALWALSQSAWFVETAYARGVGFQISRVLSIVTGWLPLSLAALVIAGVVAYLLVPFVVTIVKIFRGERRWVEALGAGALRFATFAAVATTVFYLSWGLHYSRAPLAARLGWSPMERPTDEASAMRLTEEIAALTTQLVEATNDRYRRVAGSEDLGRPSMSPEPLSALDAALDESFARVQRELGLEPQFAASRGPAKPFLGSRLLSHFQLTGFYFPWTGEANYNRHTPGPTLPHTMAHEKAHQRGIAREDEANFIAYLVCIMSADPYAQYAGYFFAQRHLLAELVGRNPARAKELVKLGSAGVWRDVTFIRDYWAQFEGVAARVSYTVNDRYLKSQGIRAGVASYAASRSLILMYARQRGGLKLMGGSRP